MNNFQSAPVHEAGIPALHAVFQPIVHLREGTILGHEALIRGPADTPLHEPLALLAWASAASFLTGFEVRCVQTILAQWQRMASPGQLFINMSADALVEAMAADETGRSWFEDAMAHQALDARSIIVELTESPAHALYDDSAQQAGGIEAEDRYGVLRFTPLTSLSIGAVCVVHGTAQDAEGIASEAAQAKHAAKQAPNGLWVRRVAD